MSLVPGRRMVRADDGMRGVVSSVPIPGFEHMQELRIVYTDRGEERVAPKREAWNEESPPPRKLRPEEILNVASFTDNLLRSIDKNELSKWWEWGQKTAGPYHDPVLVDIIIDYLSKRG